MKKKISIIFLIGVLCCCAVFLCTGCSLFSSEAVVNYKDTDGGKMISSYEGNTSNTFLIIPDEYEGEPVVEIGDFGVAACEYLTTLTIGKNVQKISERAFCSLPNLQEFIVSAENPYFMTIDGVLFTKDGTELVAYPNKKSGDGSYVVPEGVTKIRSCAFYCCTSLLQLTLGSNVTEVGDYACMKCTEMTALTLNQGVKKIGKDGFSFCNKLDSLVIPSSVEEIGDYAFYSKESKIKTFVVQKDVSKISCGKNWKPQTSGLTSSALEPTIEEE